MRLIDADALLDGIYSDNPKDVMLYIAKFPTVEPEQRWIPCSDRLPEAECGESESVLVCFENGTQDVLYFNGGNWCYPTGETYISRNYKNGWHNEVVAWMPLPEPWEGDANED